MKRWDWTWEEPRAPARASTEADADAPSGGLTGPSPAPPGQFRRRRGGGALALVAILALAIAAISSRSAGHHTSRSVSGRQPASRHAVTARLTKAEQDVLTHQAEEKAIDRVRSYTPAITAGGSQGNEVALTFDDGPGPYTQRLVDVLNALHVQATFFAIGEEERYFSAGTTAELRSGDVVGDHTETHPMMATLSAHDQREQLLEQIYRIQLLDGPTPRLFRPPYGSFNATTLKELRALHLLMVLWSTDTRDYTLPGVAAIVQSALAGAHPGAIILMHDAGGNRSETVAALPAIIAGLRKRGLRPVTIPRLMLDDPPPPGQPLPKSLAGD
jgi:peptidoglycan/xylan/chitin deacetylase (PgdA/CDA1 family)